MKKIMVVLLTGLFLATCAHAQSVTIPSQDLERALRLQDYGQQLLQNYKQKRDAAAPVNSVDDENRLITEQLQVISGDEGARYIIVPGDTLTISFNDRGSEDTAVYQVSSDGDIFLPLAGKTKIDQIDRNQAQQRIDEVLGIFIRKPDAHIKINMDGRVMVLGAVGHPGMVEFNQQHLTLMDVLLDVGIGSYNPRTANLNSVLVMRGPINKPIILRLDLRKMIKKGDRSDNILLKPGDLVYVPTTFMSELDSFAGSLYQKYLMWSDLGGQDLIKTGKPFIGPF